MKKEEGKIVLESPKAVEFFKAVEKKKEELRAKIMNKFIAKGILKQK